jgi:demethylmenaquinone methyltransferase/2-methoxy-6-polyprenyl-1,4-benzoquinol methylase
MTALEPHRPLTRYYAAPEERGGFVRRLFDRTAGDYDWISRLFSFGSGGWYRRQALRRAGVGAGMAVLDIAAGTGQVAAAALELVGPTGAVTGLDQSSGMLRVARRRVGVAVVQAGAEELPFPDATFDVVTMGYALRHVADLTATFREYRRVLKPGGRALILELTRPGSHGARRLLRLWLHRVVPAIARIGARSPDAATLMRYFWDTVEECVPPEAILAAIEDAGFADVRRELRLGMFSEYRAFRRRPEAPLAAAGT